MSITKDIDIEQIRSFLGGKFPSYHPEEYFKLRLDAGHAFAVTDTDGLAAFLIYSVWWGNSPFIELIKVDHKFQRRGLGTQLLNAAKKEIKAKGFEYLFSSTEVINDMGLGFHLKQGFERLNTLNLGHGEELFFRMEL